MGENEGVRRVGRVTAAVAVIGLLVAGVVGCESDPPTSAPTTSTTTTTRPVVTPLPGCRGTGASTTTSNIRYATATGVDPNLLSLDLTVPTMTGRCGMAPVLVWVHGGGFTIGDKANRMADKVRWATAQGWAIASVNYRLSPQTDPPPAGRVMHPTHVTDVARAVDWLVDHASEHKLDPDRIMLAGHSAGAFLVALLGTDPSFLRQAGVDPGRIRGVVALDTRYDIAAEMAEGDPTTVAMYRNAFGTDPAVWRSASPQTHAGGDPPFLVVTRGQAARRAASEAFATALRAGGGTATVLDARPLDHEGVNVALGAAGETVVTPAVTRFLDAALDSPVVRPR